MNQVAEYVLMGTAALCALAFVGCAGVTLVLIPVAFGDGFRAFKHTKDLRDIMVPRGEPPWVLQAYVILRKVQRFSGVATLAFGGIAMAVQLLT
jgi:hypothetical protein